MPRASTQPKLRFRETELRRLANRYPAEVDGDIESIAARARKRGHLERDEFLRICRWKTPRSQKNCAKNSQSLVAEATTVAFAANNEEIKIGTLLLLSGVAWPTASVILHLCDKAPYPILDVRAMWSVGFERPPVYTFDLWWKYTQFTRELARRTKLTMREVDRALWQYSKENQ
jgi:hypothetical protein